MKNKKRRWVEIKDNGQTLLRIYVTGVDEFVDEFIVEISESTFQNTARLGGLLRKHFRKDDENTERG